MRASRLCWLAVGCLAGCASAEPEPGAADPGVIARADDVSAVPSESMWFATLPQLLATAVSVDVSPREDGGPWQSFSAPLMRRAASRAMPYVLAASVVWKRGRLAVATLEDGRRIRLRLGREDGPVFSDADAWSPRWMLDEQDELDWRSEWSRLEDPPERYVRRMQLLAALPELFAEISDAYASRDAERLIGLLAPSSIEHAFGDELGRTAIERHVRDHVASTRGVPKPPRMRIVSAEDYARCCPGESYEATITWTSEREIEDPGTGTVRIEVSTARFIAAWVRRDGAWKLVHVDPAGGLQWLRQPLPVDAR